MKISEAANGPKTGHGFVFVFFSLAGTKLHHYLVYGYIPLVIFMARTVDENKTGRAWRLVLGRLPGKQEQARATRLVDQHGLALLCRVLFNSNEFILID